MRSVGIAVALVCFAGVATAAPTKPASPKSKPAASKQLAKRSSKKPTKRAKRLRSAISPKSRFAIPDDIANAPAVRYAAMTTRECFDELDSRKVSYVKESWSGVRDGVRLTGPLRGVEFRTNLAAKQRATTPWEIADCRLVLAIDDFAEILAAHDVIDVRHYSIHRLVPKSWPNGKQATRHMGGVAIDAARFLLEDGTYLDVDKHWNGGIGRPTCGDKAAPYPATAEAVKLRAILCEAVSRRLFNVVLTPNYNRPHKNHFHLEVTEGVKWFLVH
jgi:hypothetical protein